MACLKGQFLIADERSSAGDRKAGGLIYRANCLTDVRHLKSIACACRPVDSGPKQTPQKGRTILTNDTDGSTSANVEDY